MSHLGLVMIFKVKLREAQRPVKLRDGIGGPMLRVTDDEWATFERWPEVPGHIATDTSLEVEVLTEITITPAPVAEVTESAAPPRKKRRGRPPKKKEPEPEAAPALEE